jgi:hypothetical protein
MITGYAILFPLSYCKDSIIFRIIYKYKTENRSQ